jgi:hypothetical protein
VTAIPQRDLARGRQRVDAGILDRVPSAFESEQFLAGTPVQSLEQWVEGLARVSRTIFGRPPAAYGVTPIVIFRKIAD